MDVERARATIAAEKPRRLRLDEMLRDLGAHVGDEPPPPRPEGITVGELVDKAAEAGFGFLVGVLALIAIPFFGLSTPFGLAIALVGIQLAIARGRPWLPRRTRRRTLSMTMLDRVLGLLSGRARWLSRSTRRRLERAIMPRLVGIAITVLGLGLALPLPIPGSNMMFIVPILVYAVGLLERDGLWIVIGHIGALVDLTLAFVFGATVVTILQHAWHWIF
ncbi:MAG TPA: exopolysaccharide biosynthesis protein [Kofleriaceae bacterium]|nr:exopolysaccharide biosynthesis protein [Kofleriaceae bacterium]